MLMLRTQGIWNVFDTDGKLMWKPDGLRFQSPKGFIKGFFCALQPKGIRGSLDSLELEWGESLIDVQGKGIWQPQANFPYRILTAIDVDSCALVENLETGERGVFGRGEKMLSNFFPDLAYLGKGLVIYADTNTLQNVNKTYIIENFYQKKIFCRLNATEIGETHNEMLHFIVSENGKKYMGFLNLNDGKIAIPPKYEVKNEYDESNPPPQYSDNLIVLHKENEAFIFNKNGKSLINKSFAEIESLGKSFFKMREKEDSPAFLYKITENNVQKIEIKGFSEGFDDIGKFTAQGTTWFIKTEKVGILNNLGKIILPLQKYQSVFINENYIFLNIDNHLFKVINAKGKTIREVKAESLTPFKFGLSIAEFGTQKSVIREDGSILLKDVATKCEIEIYDEFIETKCKMEGDKIQFNFYNSEGRLVLENPMERLNGDWIIPIAPLEFYILY